jgi:hypothetical protein
MKYSIGDTLYLVDPFVFTILSVTIVNFDDNYEPIYYIDENGAYMEECTLFESLAEAKQEALILLEEFYINRRLDINSYKGEENV